MWSERARYRRDGRFVVWLHTLARNRCRNHLRHHGVTQSYARSTEAARRSSEQAGAVGESTLRSRVHHGLELLRSWLEDES